MTEVRADLTPWIKKTYVIANSENVQIFKKNGTLLHTIPIEKIVGVYYKPATLAGFGLLRFCTTWEDLRGGLVDNSQPDAVTVDKPDHKGVEALIEFVNEQISGNEDKSPYDAELHGVVSSIYLIDNKIMIKHKGLLSAINRGLVGEKVIPIANITSIQFKRATVINGYIQFATAASEATGGAFDATKDENSVLFSPQQEEEFAAFRDRIQKMIDESVDGRGAGKIDPLDQIKKLKELFDAGILTSDEYESKKQSLLGKI